MNLSPLPIQKFFDNNGEPLVSGLLFTFEAGTSNKIATYTDSSGLSLNTNPIVLDYRGECRLWIDASLTYKFVLANRNDTDPPTNPIWTVDDIQSGVSLADLTRQFIGRILYPITLAEITASVMPVNYYEQSDSTPILDARRFGVAADGITDDTVALKNFLLALGTGYYETTVVGQAIGFIPGGVMVTSQTLTIPQSCCVVGVPNKSVIRPTNAISTAVIMAAGSTLEKVVIDGVNTSGKIGVSIGVGALVNEVVLRDVIFARFAGSGGIGCLTANAVKVLYENCLFLNNATGCKLINTGTALPTTQTFQECLFRANTGRGFWMQTGVVCRLESCTFELNGLEGSYVHNAATESFTNNTVFDTCWWEGNQQSLASGPTRHAAYQAYFRSTLSAIRDSHFEGNANEARAMFFESATGFVVDHTDIINEAGQVGVDSASNGSFVSWPTTNGSFDSLVSVAAGGFANFLNETTGTFQPDLTFATPGNLALTYSSRVARWTRIGNRVIVQVSIQTATFTHTTASGTLRIQTLPFAAKNTSDAFAIGSLSWGGITKAGYTNIIALVSPNTTFVQFVGSGSGVATSSVTATDTPSGGVMTLQLTIAYEV